MLTSFYVYMIKHRAYEGVDSSIIQVSKGRSVFYLQTISIQERLYRLLETGVKIPLK
jgi:hypothetical protein